MPDETKTVTSEPFGTDEPLWYYNGRWGAAGYGVANPGGKVWCVNGTVWGFVNTIGRALFDIMHREDKDFVRPVSKQTCWDVYQLCTLGRKRLLDRAIPEHENQMQPKHSGRFRKEFILYPVPFFGDAIRNQDLAEWCDLCLRCLTEAMQHSEADKAIEVTQLFAADIGQYVRRILFHMATKYFGYSRDKANEADLVIPEDDWKTFNPLKWAISHETTEERHDAGWTPTENDLRAIRGITATSAMAFARRYPVGAETQAGGTGADSTPANPAGATGAFVNPQGPPQ